MFNRHAVFPSLLVLVIAMGSGCTQSQKASPHMDFRGISFEGGLARDDFEVLNRVEGTSTTRKILLGLIEIIDPDRLKGSRANVEGHRRDIDARRPNLFKQRFGEELADVLTF